MVDGAAAWGETYVGYTEVGNLHPDTLGAQKYGAAFRDAYATAGYALGLNYGVSNPADNIVAAWNLAAGTSSGKSTITGTIAIGITAVASISGLSINRLVVTISIPILAGDAAVMADVPALRLDISGTAAAQGNITITQAANVIPRLVGADSLGLSQHAIT